MTLRAAAISAETRPSDLATCPMTSNVDLKKRTPISSARRCRRGARGNTLIVEVTEHQTDEQAPRTSKQQQPEERADEFSGHARRGELLRCMATMLHDAASPPIHTTSLRGLKKIHTGKVRDIYEIDADSMLIVTTDRLSAFDVVLPDPIPDKGRVLNSISNFWFETHHAHRAESPDRRAASTRWSATPPSAPCWPIAPSS